VTGQPTPTTEVFAVQDPPTEEISLPGWLPVGLCQSPEPTTTPVLGVVRRSIGGRGLGSQHVGVERRSMASRWAWLTVMGGVV